MTVEASVPARTAYDEWLDHRWRVTGAVIALLCLVGAALVLMVGEKRSDLGALQDGVVRGHVTHVEVEGLPRGGTWSGESPVTLHWSGAVDRYVEVLVIRGLQPRGATGNAGLPYVVGDPAQMLRALDPEVDVARVDGRGDRWTLAGWRVPAAAGWLGLVAWAATMLLLVGGPEPWRATRWAWFWLVLASGPLGVLAHLLLGGPLGVKRPAAGSGRLTGGWAFLLASLVPAGWWGATGG